MSFQFNQQIKQENNETLNVPTPTFSPVLPEEKEEELQLQKHNKSVQQLIASSNPNYNPNELNHSSNGIQTPKKDDGRIEAKGSSRMKTRDKRGWRTCIDFGTERVLDIIGTLEGFNMENDSLQTYFNDKADVLSSTYISKNMSLNNNDTNNNNNSFNNNTNNTNQINQEKTTQNINRFTLTKQSSKNLYQTNPKNTFLKQRSDIRCLSPSASLSQSMDNISLNNSNTSNTSSNLSNSSEQSLQSSNEQTSEKQPEKKTENAYLKSLMQEPQEKKTYRQRILDEFVKSEHSYVLGLKLCVRFYKEPLSKQPKVCDPEMFEVIFRGFDDVYRMNCNFLMDLNGLKNKNGGKSLDTHLGEAFGAFVPLLSIYKLYVGNGEHQMAALSKLEQKESFVELCDKLQEQINVGHAQNLRGYLITPVQRLPRYKLLLEDLIKNTPEDHCDLQRLKDALSKVKEINTTVNKSIDLQTKQNKMIELSEKIKGINDLIQPDRYYICDGPLTQITRKGKEVRHFFMFNDRLISGKPGEQVIVLFDEKMENIMIEDDSDSSFNVLSPELSFEIVCPNEDVKRAWVTKFVDAINSINQSLTVQNQKRTIQYAPLWLPEDIQKCQICGRNFNLIYRKQFCIHCGLCVCNGCYRGRFVFNGVNKRSCDRCMKKALMMNKIIVDEDMAQKKTIRMKGNKQQDIILKIDGVDLNKLKTNNQEKPIVPSKEIDFDDMEFIESDNDAQKVYSTQIQTGRHGLCRHQNMTITSFFNQNQYSNQSSNKSNVIVNIENGKPVVNMNNVRPFIDEDDDNSSSQHQSNSNSMNQTNTLNNSNSSDSSNNENKTSIPISETIQQTPKNSLSVSQPQSSISQQHQVSHPSPLAQSQQINQTVSSIETNTQPKPSLSVSQPQPNRQTQSKVNYFAQRKTMRLGGVTALNPPQDTPK